MFSFIKQTLVLLSISGLAYSAALPKQDRNRPDITDKKVAIPSIE